MSHRFSLFILLIAFMTLSCLQASAQWEHNYFTETHTLDWNQSKVAIKWKSGYEDSSLLELGIKSEQVETYALKGWSMVTVPVGISGEPAFTNYLALLAGHDIIEFAAPVFIDSCGGPMFPTQELLVRFNANFSKAEAIEILSQHGVVLESDWAAIPGAYRVLANSANGARVLKSSNTLAAMRGVIFAEPNFCFTGEKVDVPNDTRLGEQWAVSQTLGLGYAFSDIDMDIIEAWDLSTGSSAVKVAVLDDGVQKDHPDMPYEIAGVDTTTDPGDGGPFNQFDNHGTSVAGIISAIRNNGLGIGGLAPDAQLTTARCYLSVSNQSFITMSSWTVNALAWCETNGVRITNNSVVLGALAAATTTKYNLTAANGMMHFAAAGNNPALGTRYPATLASVYGMIGLSFDGQIATFSASSAAMAFSAPADQVLTTDRSGADGFVDPDDYVYQAGTSFATAYASAAAALAFSINPALTASEVASIMSLTARDLGAPGVDSVYAGGMLNAYGIAFQVAQTLPNPEDKLYMQQGVQTDDHFGAAVSLLGDLNADGFTEFAVAAPLFDGVAGADAGHVRIYSGAKGNLMHTVEGVTAGEQFGSCIVVLGDLDLDLVPDYGIGAPLATAGGFANAGNFRVYSGATHTQIFLVEGTQANERLGSNAISLDDTNSDTRSDFAVCSPGATVGATANVGQIKIRSGIDGSSILVIDGDELTGDLDFGAALVRIDDQDNDGVEDILVGVPGATPGGADSGRIVLISSVTGNRVATIDGTAAGDRFGASVSTWADQNVDGKRDWAVGIPGYDGPTGIDSGVVVVFASNSLVPAVAFFGENGGDEFGTTVVNNIDMDGDHIEDIIIGAPGFDGAALDCGKIYSYSTASATPRFEILGREADQHFGSCLSSLGDIDGDGLGEVLVGAQGSSATARSGFAVVLPARNPNETPVLDESIMAGTLGSTENGPYDCFLINNSAGGPTRTIIAGISEPISYSMLQPHANPNPAHFALYGYLGFPSPLLSLTLPFSIGPALWVPCTATPANPIGFLITNSTFADPCPQLVASTPTPWHFTDTVGVPFPITVTFYAIIEEAGLKVANSIILKIQ